MGGYLNFPFTTSAYLMRCLNASVKLTGRQQLGQVGSPVPNVNSVGNACVARPGI